MDNTKGLNTFFEAMWSDYCKLNPQALAVFSALTNFGEKVVNDHIAFRTFGHPSMTIDVLSPHFLKYGYVQKAEYTFEEKKLRAKHFEHPDETQPLVFISELDLKKVSPFVAEVAFKISREMDPTKLKSESFMYGGRPWKADFETYKKLAQESEYAAWVYAHGFRPNHFTVYINHLVKLNQIADLNTFLKNSGFKLNSSGGEIKGTIADYLEQSSTMANEIPVQFNDGSHTIPGCYYEFAKRYPLPSGKLFRGFVGKSADKIFESTNKL